ncbi:hypothetical protein GGQ59_000895 [Parvularcula dongshanensis]|uniref:Uncharacterized protein n=1 Tax=Parvularcula dongshanensis TaxID=1173995 RepID=A0A840I232_9PROT|nr:hypothetical protein [Parvularcula dongshanensis]
MSVKQSVYERVTRSVTSYAIRMLDPVGIVQT